MESSPLHAGWPLAVLVLALAAAGLGLLVQPWWTRRRHQQLRTLPFPRAWTRILQRRVPGQAFVGEAKAQQFDSGQFRRLPMPGDRTGEGRGVTSDDVSVAERRLRALSGLQTGAGRARSGDAEDTEDQS